MEENKQACACEGQSVLIFACSGGADVGAVSDQAARELTRRGAGKMYCLAGVGGKISGIVKTAEGADRILAIDGCPLDCARQTLAQAGLTDIQHLRLTDHGMPKGESPATPDRISQAADLGAAILEAGR